MKTILMTLLTAASVSAFAQEATPDTWITEAKSVLTRAEVMADLQRARHSGEFALLHAEAHDFREEARLARYAVAPRSRGAVKADLERARVSGEFALIQAEAFDFGLADQIVRYAAREAVVARR